MNAQISGVLAGGAGGHGPPSEDFLGGAKIQRGRQNCSKALVKTFITILESDEPMKMKNELNFIEISDLFGSACASVSDIRH